MMMEIVLVNQLHIVKIPVASEDNTLYGVLFTYHIPLSPLSRIRPLTGLAPLAAVSIYQIRKQNRTDSSLQPCLPLTYLTFQIVIITRIDFFWTKGCTGDKA